MRSGRREARPAAEGGASSGGAVRVQRDQPCRRYAAHRGRELLFVFPLGVRSFSDEVAEQSSLPSGQEPLRPQAEIHPDGEDKGEMAKLITKGKLTIYT